MKALLLSSTNDWTNGYGNIAHEYSKYLEGRLDFTLLLPRDEPKRTDSYPARHILPPYIFNLKSRRVLEYLRFSFDASGYDVIHSLFEFPYALIAARLAAKYDKPLIIGTQGTYAIQPLFWYPEKWLVKRAYNRASLITAPSAFTRENIIRYSGTKTPVKIIHNAVNFARFQKPLDVEPVRGRWPGKKLLLTVGGLKPRKGHDVVIRALGLLKERDDFHYLVVGSGKLKKQLTDLAEAEGVAGRVSFIGQVDGPELVRYFQACDAYVHTPILSNWQFEGFGIVYLEASACRKPIVASDSGGVRDAVVDGETGIVVPESDPWATADAIARILDDATLAQRLGAKGHEYAARHTWQWYGSELMKCYEEITKK